MFIITEPCITYMTFSPRLFREAGGCRVPEGSIYPAVQGDKDFTRLAILIT